MRPKSRLGRYPEDRWFRRSDIRVNSQLLYILVLATVAGIILFRLYTVLGRRTGHERPPQERFERIGGASEQPKPENVILLPERTAQTEQAGAPNDPIARGLLDIKLADRSFDTNHFLDGARRAYEIIVTAFARGERDTLRPLLSEEVYSAFDQVIRDREARKDRIEFTFVGFGEVKVTGASLKKNIAEITVSFATQFISATSDTTGKIIDGDPKAVRDVTDSWSFERAVRASDPNWRLVATSGEADLQAH
jgi:predicted lipid-binding transport protein (Tim44 family)